MRKKYSVLGELIISPENRIASKATLPNGFKNYASKHFKLKILFILIIFTQNYCTAQIYNSQLNHSYNIKSPEISSLEKFIDIPADYNSGLPTTTIPIFTIKTKRMEIPIFLTYHHDGIKVEEVATNVGLGWNLVAGGAIIREARGLPDNKHFFDTGRRAIEDQTFTVSAPSLVNDSGDMNIVNRYLEEQWEEYKPDIFKVQAPMLDGGAFYFPAYGINFVHEQKPYSIQYSMGGSPGNPIDSFTLSSFQGVQYQFYTQETTINNQLGYTPSLNYTSAFKLSQMKDLLFNEIVDFQYSQGAGFTSYFVSSSQSAGPSISNNCFQSGTNDSFSQDVAAGNTVYAQRLDVIYFPKGKVQFIYGSLPSNVSGSGEKLNRVEIYSITGFTYSLVKAVNFKYSNFQTANLAATWSTLSTYKGANRLKLDSIQEEYNGVLKPPYIFAYDETPLPYYHSLSRDHFGYFNGVNNESLIPYKSSNLSYEIGNISNSTYSQNLVVGRQSVNRDSNFSFLMAGSLAEITFPTGGKTKYIFEANKSESYPKQWGKRIQKIELKEADNSIIRSQTFTYHNSLQSYYNIDDLYNYYQ